MKKNLILSSLLLSLLLVNACSKPEETWELVWADEFDSNGTPDTTRWDFDLADGCPAVCGWGNNELQYYTDDTLNVRQSGGHLLIEARKDSIKGKSYSSARLVTRGKAEWLYGRFEIRAKLPDGRGTWPAIWMLPGEKKYGEWPRSGEIDIMEHVGYDPGVVHGTLHSDKYNHMKGTQKEGMVRRSDVQDDFHTYIVEWEPETVRFMVDDSLYHQVNKVPEDDHSGWPFDQKFYLILNLAVGGNWGGKQGVDPTIWPRRMEVDFVRVYQRPVAP